MPVRSEEVPDTESGRPAASAEKPTFKGRLIIYGPPELPLGAPPEHIKPAPKIEPVAEESKPEPRPAQSASPSAVPAPIVAPPPAQVATPKPAPIPPPAPVIAVPAPTPRQPQWWGACANARQPNGGRACANATAGPVSYCLANTAPARWRRARATHRHSRWSSCRATHRRPVVVVPAQRAAVLCVVPAPSSSRCIGASATAVAPSSASSPPVRPHPRAPPRQEVALARLLRVTPAAQCTRGQ